jgi:hypothetical protein
MESAGSPVRLHAKWKGLMRNGVSPTTDNENAESLSVAVTRLLKRNYTNGANPAIDKQTVKAPKLTATRFICPIFHNNRSADVGSSERRIALEFS